MPWGPACGEPPGLAGVLGRADAASPPRRSEPEVVGEAGSGREG